MEPLIEIPDYASISQAFAQELSLASQSVKTSLPFIRNILPKDPLVKRGQRFQVFVIGGTHGSAASAQINNEGKLQIIEQKSFTPLPVFVTKKDFLEFIHENLDDKTEAIAINFAYNLTPIVGEGGILDGIMNQGDTKGHAFTGLQNEQVGKTVSKFLKETTGRAISTTIANDTICLLTSGLDTHVNRRNLIAVIAGTGYNLAMFLDNNTAVNLQASDFSSFTQTKSGRVVDTQSKNIGEQLYNKEVAAGDLYKHFNALIGPLHLPISPLQSSEELSIIAGRSEGKASQIAKELFRRSASFVAAQLAGIYIFKGNPQRITCIIQGSLFMKQTEYILHIQGQLTALRIPENTFVFTTVENSDILGAIKLLTG